MKPLVLFIAFFILSYSSLYSQNPTISIQTQQACPDDDIYISIYVENVYDLGAITLFIGYDTTGLEFISAENINPQLSGLLYNEMTIPQTQLGISWSGIYGVNLVSEKLLDMKFHYTAGNSNLTFNPGCEIANSDLEIIQANYVEGNVLPKIEILIQPKNQSVKAGLNAHFEVFSIGATQFQWQKSSDGGLDYIDLLESEIYLGVQTDSLELNCVTPDLDETIYRCLLSSDACSIYSDFVFLSVEIPITQDFILHSGWNSLATFIVPESLSLDVVFGSITDVLEIVSDGSNVYIPNGAINNIGEFDPGKGYYLKVSELSDFSISGSVDTLNAINLSQGWNIFPVVSACGISLNSISQGQLDKIEAIVEIAGTKVFWPEKNIYSLHILETTNAYMLKASQDFVFEIPECTE